MSATTPEDILAALDAGELELHYQPQVATASRTTCGAEALLRWRHPQRGLLGAGEVVPVLEAGPICALATICRATLHRACRDTASIANEEIGVAVNVSALDIARRGFVEDVVEALMSTKLASHRLEIEITETQRLQDTQIVRQTLAELHELNITLALDDYGTGHATIESMDLIDADTLKLPRELVSTITTGGAHLVHAALSIANTRHMDVVAEGVETEAQIVWLARRGVALVQGYHTGRPMPLGEYRALVSRGPERARLSA